MSTRSVRRRDLRLVPVAAAAWAAAVLATLAPDAAGGVAAGAGAMTVAGLVVVCLAARRGGLVGAGVARRASPGRARVVAAAAPVLAVVAVACAAMTGVAVHVAVAAPARDALAALPVDGGRSIVFDALVVGKAEGGAIGIRFDAIVTRATVGTQPREVSGPVLVRADRVPAGLDVGADIELRGTAFAADAGERAVLVVDATEVSVRAPPAGALAAAAALRRGLHDVVDGLPQPGAGLVAGLAVGDTAGVSVDLDAQMKASSLSHLTAVSGANCALVVGLAFAAAALCGARRGVRVAVALGALIGFTVLVTPEPSVVRASAMAAIAMLGLLLGRVGAGLSLLTVAVTVILLLDPWLCLSLGFALSTAATAALLLLAGPLADGLARWMPAPVALVVAVPLSAQLACGPLIVLIAPTLPLQGVLANLLAGPAAPAATVLGLAACLTAGIPVLGAGLAGLAWLPAAWIAGTAQTLAAVAVVPWPEGPWGAMLLAVVGAAVAVSVIAVRGRVRTASVVFVCAAAGLLLGVGPGAVVSGRLTAPTSWAILACEVGQGDAVLVRSAGRVMLVDTGPAPEPLAACLDRYGVDRIDVLVLTHFDLDHRGGIDAVVGRIGVLVHGPPADAADAELLARVAASGADTRAVVAGASGMLGDAHWRVLWPRRGATPGNDASVVVDVAGGAVPATLLLGDLSEEPQRLLAAGGALRPRYDVVKVAHHGSADQSAGLYQATHPRIALVTVGENDYGHPRASILATLDAVGAVTARTDRGGDALVWLEDDALKVWRPRADEVGPDG